MKNIDDGKGKKRLSKATKTKIQFWAATTGVLVVCVPLIFMLPIWMGLEGTDERQMRHQLILMSGGAIALVTLWETNKRNALEHDKLDQTKAELQQRILENTEATERSIQQYNNREERDAVESLRARYSKAVELLGSDNPTIRQGGVYVLSGLADDWIKRFDELKEADKSQAQIVVDTLCSYIRTPIRSLVREDNVESLAAETLIRESIFNVIKNHLLETTSVPRWSDLKFDFRGAHIDYPFDLTDLVLERNILWFAGANITGRGIDISRTVMKEGSIISFADTNVSSSAIVANHLKIYTKSHLTFYDARIRESAISMKFVELIGESTLDFTFALFIRPPFSKINGDVGLTFDTVDDSRVLFRCKILDFSHFGIIVSSMRGKGRINLSGLTILGSQFVLEREDEEFRNIIDMRHVEVVISPEYINPVVFVDDSVFKKPNFCPGIKTKYVPNTNEYIEKCISDQDNRR